MRIDPRELDGTSCDLLVIGAGIQGAAIAREAAARGLAVVLCDARDVAAGASSCTSRLVHGGLEDLAHGDMSVVRAALAERERLLRQSPHLVRPLPVIVPRHRDRGVAASYRELRRYHGLAGASTLPAPRRLTPDEAVAAFPGLRSEGLTGATLHFDGVTHDVRLALANALAACEAGARLATHCEVRAAVADGVRLLDRLGGGEVTVRTTQVVNAAGAGADAVRRALGIDGPARTRQRRCARIVLPPRPGEPALAVRALDGRATYLVPHEGGTHFGWREADDSFPGEETGPVAEDLALLLAGLEGVLASPPRRSEVCSARAGWRSVPAGRGAGSPRGDGREARCISERARFGRLHTVVGGRLTTHRASAESLLRRLFGLAGPSPTHTTPLPGGEGPQEPADPLWRRHGSRALAVRRLSREVPALSEPLCPHRPFLAAEAVYALRDLGAVTFADLMLRRLAYERGPCLDEACLVRAFELFARERRAPDGDELEAALAVLLRELTVQEGDLAVWREHPGAFEVRQSSSGSRP